MAAPQIVNVIGAGGEPLINVAGKAAMSNDFLTVIMINNSGATRTQGDVVVTDAGGLNATTTTTAADKTVIGVVSQQPLRTYASGNTMPVIVKGVARVNIGTTTVSAGDFLTSSTTAAVATSATTTFTGGAVFAVALEANSAKDTDNTIRCKLL